MKKQKTEDWQVKVIALGMCVIMILLLIPLFAIAHYSVKSVDDFVYFQQPEAIWNSTHSLWTLLKEQFIYAWEYWETWQGTYFSEWLVTFVMGLCGDKFYFVGAYLSIGGIVVSELILFKVIFVNLLQTDLYRTLIVGVTCILMQILLIPSPVEGFYWFCGSGIYTWMYAVAALFVALCISTICRRDNKKWKLILREAGILFLAFAVGGSNYVVLMLVFVLFAGGLFLLWIYRHRDRVLMSFNFLFYTGCALTCVCAPGNQNRLDSAGTEGYSIIESVFRALYEGAMYLIQWSVLPYLVAGIILIPVMWRMVQAKQYKYPVPFVVTLVTFGMFAAQFTPTLYTLGIIGARRIINIYRITMVLWLYGNEYYWIGWFARRSRESNGASEKGTNTNSWMLPGWCTGMVVLALSLSLWGGSTVTSYSAVQALRSGQAQQYKAEYEARREVLMHAEIKRVEFTPYTAPPYLLYFGDIVEDENDWVNRSVAAVYGKESVRLIKNGEKTE